MTWYVGRRQNIGTYDIRTKDSGHSDESVEQVPYSVNTPWAGAIQREHTLHLMFPLAFPISLTRFLDASTYLYKRVCPSVAPSGTRFFSMSRLWEKMVGNDKENSLNAPNPFGRLPNCPRMSQMVLKCPKMSNSDASLSERTCLVFFLMFFFFVSICICLIPRSEAHS